MKVITRELLSVAGVLGTNVSHRGGQFTSDSRVFVMLGILHKHSRRNQSCNLNDGSLSRALIKQVEFSFPLSINLYRKVENIFRTPSISPEFYDKNPEIYVPKNLKIIYINTCQKPVV